VPAPEGEDVVKQISLMTKWLPAVALALALTAGVGWWLSSPRAEDEAQGEAAEAIKHEGTRLLVPEGSPLRRTLAVQQVVEQNIAAEIVVPAVVEADQATLVRVLPPLAGRIVNLRKRLGDSVKEGEPLFEIESGDLANALSDATKADSALVLTKQALDRLRELQSTSIAAERDLEQAQSDYDQAVSESKRADSVLAQLGAVDRSLIKGGNRLEVRSPISGSIVDLTAGNGGYWNDPTASTMSIADLSKVFVTGSAQERDLRHFYVGQEATVALDSYPDRVFRGTVQYISELLDPDTRTVKIRMIFENRNGQFKPGMFAQATYRDRPRKGTVVPVMAVVQSGFYNRAFVEVEPWVFEPRVIELGRRFGDQIEVLSGLKSGERVVVKQGVVLNNG
jgi:cobalt-zinc-cadmium efflux system membrane fusion protein